MASCAAEMRKVAANFGQFLFNLETFSLILFLIILSLEITNVSSWSQILTFLFHFKLET